MRKLLKQRWIAIILFLLGSLHLLIIHQTYQPNSYVKTETNEFYLPDEDGDVLSNDETLSPPTRIVVWGERESGADAVVQVLKDAFDTNVSRHGHIARDSLLDEQELESLSSQRDILWIVVVRSPCEWAEAMIQLKREGCEKDHILQNNRGLIKCPVEMGGYNFEWEEGRHDVDGEHIIPSGTQHTITYQNVFEFRRRNLLIMQQVVELVPRHVKIVRLGEFELNPHTLVKDLVKEYQDFPLKSNYEPIPVNIKPPPSLCMTKSKWKEAQSLIDWKIEGYFGHHSWDCHLCHDDEMDSDQDDVEPPSMIYLLGERNSGTTFVSDTLAEAFDPPNSMGSNLEKFSSGIPVLLHKHMFRHDLLNETELAEIKARTDILWVLVVRSPCDWAEGMFRKPYHLCPPKFPERCGPESDPNNKIWLNQNSMIGVKLLDLFTTFPWVDWAESVPFLRSSTHREGDEEISISKPSANYSYPNVFALRRHKLQIMKQIMDALPRNVKLVRLKEMERSPEKFIQDMAKEFKLPIKEGYKPQDPSVLTHSTVCLTPAEWEAAETEIDWELDGEFGFSPFECRMCYGYNKSQRLYERVMQSNKVKQMLKNQSTEPQERNAKTQKTKARKEQ